LEVTSYADHKIEGFSDTEKETNENKKEVEEEDDIGL